MDLLRNKFWRVNLCFAIICLVGLTILGRAFYIQQVEGKYWKSLDDSLHLKYIATDAKRGNIYSEDGLLLSEDIPIFDLFIDFSADGLAEKNGKRFWENVDSLSYYLSGFFNDKTSNEYKKELTLAFTQKDRYYSFKKKLSLYDKNTLSRFPLIKLGKNKSGFIFEAYFKRVNHYSPYALRTIGLARGDNKNNVGLEKNYDSILRGTNGNQLVRYSLGSYKPIEEMGDGGINGYDISTTIDSYLQFVTHEALNTMMVGNNSLWGTAIVMETQTGKIKAIANLGKQANGTYYEDLNYAIAKSIEPGGTFTIATLLSLLEDNFVSINTSVDCEGGSKIFYGLKISDSHLGAQILTLKEAFARGSNVAFAKLADKYYHENPLKFVSYLQKIGLDTLTGIDIIAASAKPYIKKPNNRKTWANTTIPYMAHGYELLLTPMHLIMLYNAIANNGKMMKPYLVNKVSDSGDVITSFTPKVFAPRICSDKTLAQVKECLLAVVGSESGTAKRLYNPLYQIAGKTGTAVVAINNKGYNKGYKAYLASFIGYMPANKPKYTIAVVIQSNRESKLVYGADVAGTVFREIADNIYETLPK